MHEYILVHIDSVYFLLIGKKKDKSSHTSNAYVELKARKIDLAHNGLKLILMHFYFPDNSRKYLYSVDCQ